MALRAPLVQEWTIRRRGCGNPATGTDVRTLTDRTGTPFGVAFSPHGRLLATASGPARHGTGVTLEQIMLSG